MKSSQEGVWHPVALLVRHIQIMKLAEASEGGCSAAEELKGMHVVRCEVWCEGGRLPVLPDAALYSALPKRSVSIEPYTRELPGILALDGTLCMYDV